jgi:hypothetical protein
MWGLFILAVILVGIIYHFRKPEIIPKIIWSYWEGEDDDTVNSCIKSWDKTGYEIRVVKPDTIYRWIPDFNLSLDCSKVHHKSDLLRIKLLERYGGVWCDASIYLSSDFKWLEDKFSKTNFELFTFTLYEPSDKYNELWFLASPANSQLMKAWSKEVSEMCKDKNKYLETVEHFKYENKTEYFVFAVCLKNILKNKHWRHENENADQPHFLNGIDSYCENPDSINKKMLKLSRFDREFIKTNGKKCLPFL